MIKIKKVLVINLATILFFTNEKKGAEYNILPATDLLSKQKKVSEKTVE
jgi:hypothetical protein